MTVLRASSVTALHDAALATSADSALLPSAFASPLWYWIALNHRSNRLLWAEEDLARRTSVPDSEIARNKRRIDVLNQQRNDATERIDEQLLDSLQLQAGRGRLHSESAGSIVDRLSILALKVHAMHQQMCRADETEDHRNACRSKWLRLCEQREDLASCLDALLDDCLAGRAYFKIYRQFKMYNDARLNPALVAERTSASTREGSR